MAKYTKFEELPVWKEAARLYNRVLDLLEEPGVPLTPGFRNQLDRAALSVSNNIAEGFERVTTNELLSFLAIARGSGGEVRSMMAVVKDRPRLKPHCPALAGNPCAGRILRPAIDGVDRFLRRVTRPGEASPCGPGTREARDGGQGAQLPGELPPEPQARPSALRLSRSPRGTRRAGQEL